MEINVALQTTMFLYSLIFGITVGIFYDLFRIVRLIIPSNGIAVFIEDFIFWIFAAIISFQFILNINSGEIRLFQIIGMFLGFLLYYFTFGKLVYFVFKKISKKLNKFFCAIFTKIYSILAKINGKIKKKIIHIAQKLKFFKKYFINPFKFIKKKYRIKERKIKKKV